ncbi:MAG: hypothetical protein NT127_04360 [Sphingobacteriales bacterium]|nr:hypothetical protein [Sphingobacteriales bacterium]
MKVTGAFTQIIVSGDIEKLGLGLEIVVIGPTYVKDPIVSHAFVARIFI